MSLSLLPTDGELYLNDNFDYGYDDCEIISDNNGNITDCDSKRPEKVISCELDGGGHGEEEVVVGDEAVNNSDISIRSDIFGDDDVESPPAGEEVEEGGDEDAEKTPPITDNDNQIVEDELPINDDVTPWLGVGGIDDEPDPLTVILRNCRSATDSDEDADSDIEVYQPTRNEWEFEKRRVTRNWKWSWDKEKGSEINGGTLNTENTNTEIKAEKMTKEPDNNVASLPSMNLTNPCVVKLEQEIETTETESVRKLEGFKCPFCLDVFLEGVQLIQHLPLHTTFKPVTEKEESLPNSQVENAEGRHRTGILQRHIKKRTRRHKFSCLICNLSFPDSCHHKRHMRIHEETNRAWKCSRCKSFFLNSGSLRLHENQVHNRRPGKTTKSCTICGKSIAPSKFHEHMAYHNDERPVSCPLCSNRFRRKSHARSHMFAIHNVNVSITDLDEMLQNQQQSSPPLTYTQQDRVDELPVLSATKQFKPVNNTSNLSNSHLKKQKEDSKEWTTTHQFKCRPCKLSFRDKYSQRKHMRIHLETDRPWKCSHVQCKSYFLTSSSLRMHENSVHGRRPGATMHPCNICGGVMTSAWKLVEHMRCHNGERPFKCPKCNKRCRRREHVRAHMLSMHQEDIPTTDLTEILETQPNEISNPSLFNPNKLNRRIKTLHQTTKTPRRYKCLQCNLAFYCCKDRKRHAATHVESDDRPWKCSHCPSFFTKSTYLRKHENQVHNRRAGATMSPCNICGQVFTPYRLKEHMRNHNDEPQFTCPLCDQRFGRKEQVKAHMLSMHDEDISEEDLSAILQHQQRFNATSGESGHPAPFRESELLDKTPTPSEPIREPGSHLANGHLEKEKKFMCPICNQKFGRKDHAKRHLVTVHEDVVSNSDLEEIMLQQGWNPSPHTQENVNIPSHLGGSNDNDDDDRLSSDYQPPIKEGKPRNGFRSEIKRNEISTSKYNCTQCSLSFSDSKTLKNHMRCHVETSRPWKCGQCPSFFLTSQNLRQHENILHGRVAGQTRKSCNICGKMLPPAKLVIHMRSHSGEKPFRCPLCSHRFRRKEHAKRHLITMHEDDFSNSDLEDIAMQDRRVNHSHGKRDHFRPSNSQKNVSDKVSIRNDEPSEDDRLSNEYSTNINMGNHIYGFNRDISCSKFKCTECGLSYSDSKCLKYHMRCHIETDRPFRCSQPQCHSFFLTLPNLRNHENLLHGRRAGNSRNSCTICGKAFPPAKLVIHMRSHNDERPFPCPLCSSRFRRKEHVKTHMLTVHDEDMSSPDWKEILEHQKRVSLQEGSHQSSHSYSEVNRRKNLLEQIRPCQVMVTRCDHLIPFYTRKKPIHLSPTKMTDKNCDKKKVQFKFKSKSVVKIKGKNIDRESLIKHNTSRSTKFECTVCGKLFKQRNQILLHVVVHTNDRPFQCHLCSKRYRWKENLIVHKRIHTGLKPFQCTICSKSFSANSTLIEHSRIHSGDRPLKCEYCPGSFRFVSNFSVHMKKVHQILS